MKNGLYRAFPTELVVYGKDAAPALAAEVERLGAHKVFFLHSRTLAIETDWVQRLKNAVGPRFAGYCDGIPAHTPRESILAATALARDAGSDLIVSFGGGSVTDAAKMVRLALKHDIRRAEQFDAFATRIGSDGSRASPTFEGPSIPQIAIPTTLSGGDFNLSAGCTDARTKLKETYRHPLLVPRVVILDPSMTTRTPEWLWLSTGIRTLDHAIETICSLQADAQSYLDSLLALELLADALPRTRSYPGDLEARLDAQLAVWRAMEHNRFGISMGASHGIGHVLGGTCNVPHGYTSCVMLPAVLDYNVEFNRDRQILIAKALKQPGLSGSDAVHRFIEGLGLPRSLSAVGVGPDMFETIASAAMLEHYVHTNPRPIKSADQVLEILRAAA